MAVELCRVCGLPSHHPPDGLCRGATPAPPAPKRARARRRAVPGFSATRSRDWCRIRYQIPIVLPHAYWKSGGKAAFVWADRIAWWLHPIRAGSAPRTQAFVSVTRIRRPGQPAWTDEDREGWRRVILVALHRRNHIRGQDGRWVSCLVSDEYPTKDLKGPALCISVERVAELPARPEGEIAREAVELLREVVGSVAFLSLRRSSRRRILALCGEHAAKRHPDRQQAQDHDGGHDEERE